MDTLPSVEMQDYWNEVQTLRRVKKESLTDEHLDDVDPDATFFENLGLSISTSSQELSEENVNSDQFMGTLTVRQEEALKRRVETLNATLRQKRHKLKPSKPDIRKFFGSTDASSTGTRSRSATPDSLDSVSPPHTPPDPKGWGDPYLSRSRGSLDSGNHSLVTVPCYQPTSPTLVTVTSYHPPPTLVTVTPHSSYIVNNSEQQHHYPARRSNPIDRHYDQSSNYEPPPSSTYGGTSIVTISTSFSDGSVSPLGSNDSLTPPSRNGKYSCTYISHDSNCNSTDNGNNVRSSCSSSSPISSNGYEQNTNGYQQTTYGYHRKPNQNSKPNNHYMKRGKENLSEDDVRSSLSAEDDPDSSSEPLQGWHQYGANRYTHYPDGRINTIVRAPSLDNLQGGGTVDEADKSAARIRRQRSYARDVAKDVKFYQNKQGLYEFKPQAYHTEEAAKDVQVLKYQNIGSMHIPKYKDERAGIPLSAFKDVRKSSKDESPHNSPPSPLTDSTKQPHTVRPRSSSTTDCGFIIKQNSGGELKENFPDLELQAGRSGHTRMDWLHEGDLLKLKSLALLELEIIFGDHNISHRWRSGKRRRLKEADHGVFGVSLSSLLDKDMSHIADASYQPNVPQIFTKLINQLEVHGIREEGVLRIPGNSSKTEVLRASLDANFYSSPAVSDEALRQANHNDVVACVKLFLRLLPEPLLTNAHMAAFHKTHRIPSLEERIVSLTMLLLLIPTAHREVLKVLLQLCSKVIDNEHTNRMGLYNVATIIAPNLFPPPNGGATGKHKVKDEAKEQMLEYARASCDLCQMLIKYQDILWTVPHRLIGQIRRQYQQHKHNSKPISRLLSRKHKEPPVSERDLQTTNSCEMRLHAPQFNRQTVAVNLTHSITVRELLNKLAEEHSNYKCGGGGKRVEGRREMGGVNTTCPRHTGGGGGGSIRINQPLYTCLLRGAKHAVVTHAVHEKGGNINERRLDPNALLLAVHQDNPTADYLVRCHHAGGQIHQK